jgi:hypothetical protein
VYLELKSTEKIGEIKGVSLGDTPFVLHFKIKKDFEFTKQ